MDIIWARVRFMSTNRLWFQLLKLAMVYLPPLKEKNMEHGWVPLRIVPVAFPPDKTKHERPHVAANLNITTDSQAGAPQGRAFGLKNGPHGTRAEATGEDSPASAGGLLEKKMALVNGIKPT